jgi:hypothetical protein
MVMLSQKSQCKDNLLLPLFNCIKVFAPCLVQPQIILVQLIVAFPKESTEAMAFGHF